MAIASLVTVESLTLRRQHLADTLQGLRDRVHELNEEGRPIRLQIEAVDYQLQMMAEVQAIMADASNDTPPSAA